MELMDLLSLIDLLDLVDLVELLVSDLCNVGADLDELEPMIDIDIYIYNRNIKKGSVIINVILKKEFRGKKKRQQVFLLV